MNKYHQKILEEIKKFARLNPQPSSSFDLNNYMGTPHPIYNITSFQTKEFIDMLNSFFKGESHNERYLGGELLTGKKTKRS